MEETEENKQPLLNDAVIVTEDELKTTTLPVVIDPNFLKEAKKMGRPKDESQGGYLCGWRIMQGRRKGQLCARTAKWDGSLLGDLYGQPIISWFCKRHFLMIMKEKNNIGGYMHVVKQDEMARVLNDKLKEIKQKENEGHFSSSLPTIMEEENERKAEEELKAYAGFTTPPKPIELPQPGLKKIATNTSVQERDILNMSQSRKATIGLKINMEGETENPPSSGSEEDGISSSDEDMETDSTSSDSSMSDGTDEMNVEMSRKGVIAERLRHHQSNLMRIE